MSADVLGWLALTVIVVSSAAWFRKAYAVRLVGSRAPYVVAWILGAGLGMGALARGAGWLGGIPAGVAVALGLFFVALVAVSRQAIAADAVRVGSKLPDFTAPDEHAEPFTLSDLEGRPILLKFFRGHW